MRLALFLLFGAGISGNIQSLSAQPIGPLPVGSGPGQIGLIASPNEQCQGPVTIASAGAGKLAILDDINSKIVILAQPTSQDITLPNDLMDLVDLVVTTRGFVVADALGSVVAVDEQGSVIQRTAVPINPEAGAVRFVTGSDDRLYLENIRGDRVSTGLTPQQVGVPFNPDGSTNAAASYVAGGRNTAQVTMTSGLVAGQLSSIRVTSTRRIADARVIWVEPGAGAVLALQETRQLPSEAAFVRVVKTDAAGNPIAEAYLRPENFACGTRRPIARLSDGRIVALAVRDGDQLALETLTFQPIGALPAIELGAATGPGTMLISDEISVFNALEQLNGTQSVTPIGLNPISRDQILARARAALNLEWRLSPANFAKLSVPNLCDPMTNTWRRPHRLDAQVAQTVKGVPYRWGGYLQSLDSFAQRLQTGALAGDVCTCRNANCVHPLATGMDCSGFVSYAWRTGNYFTTASLPSNSVSSPIGWSQLAPGDIVNRRGRHVRLVEAVQTAPNGPLVTVIESASNKSCGGVCRRTYSQAELQNQGYVPLRRLALSN